MLFKLKYNILVILQVSINTLNLVLLFTNYGASEQSDIVLLSFSLLSMINLLQLLFSEQFIYYYNKIKIADLNDANLLFSNMLVYSFIISLVFVVPIYFFSEYLIKLIAYQYNDNLIHQISHFFNLLCFSIVFYLPLHIMQNILNAHNRISLSYMLSIIPQALISIGFSYLYFVNDNIENLAFFYSIGCLIAFLLNLYFIRKLFIFKTFYIHPLLKELLANSFKIRLAHNIYGVLSIVVINNFLSIFPSGNLSIFHYAKKVSDTILTVIYGPTHKILINVISTGLSEVNKKSIKDILKKINIVMPMILVPMSILIYILIPYILEIFHPMESEKVDLLKYIFLILMGQVILLSLEVPYAIVNLTKNDSQIFYISNFMFIFILVVFILMTNNTLGLYALPCGLFFSQVINYYLIRNKAKSYLIESSQKEDTK